jgi:hypothetical protein
MATELPVAAGVCESQVGATFLITVHERVFELVPFESVATNVLAPELSCDDKMLSKLPETPRFVPFKDQLTVHVASDGEIPKAVEVVPTEDTRTVAVAGELEAMAQAFCTVTFHEHVALS